MTNKWSPLKALLYVFYSSNTIFDKEYIVVIRLKYDPNSW